MISNDISGSRLELYSPLPVDVPSSLAMKLMLSPLIFNKYSAAVLAVPALVRFALELFRLVPTGTRTAEFDAIPIFAVELSSLEGTASLAV